VLNDYTLAKLHIHRAPRGGLQYVRGLL